MKKLFLMVLGTSSMFIAANKNQLEDAIIESDLKQVRTLLETTSLDEAERYSCFKLAKKILRQRRSRYSFIFPSNEEIINLAKAAGITTIGYLGTALGSTVIFNNPNLLKSILVGLPTAPFLVACLIGHASFPYLTIKHFYDYRKLWINATAIKTLLEKKEDKKNTTQHKILLGGKTGLNLRCA